MSTPGRVRHQCCGNRCGVVMMVPSGGRWLRCCGWPAPQWQLPALPALCILSRELAPLKRLLKVSADVCVAALPARLHVHDPVLAPRKGVSSLRGGGMVGSRGMWIGRCCAMIMHAHARAREPRQLRALQRRATGHRRTLIFHLVLIIPARSHQPHVSDTLRYMPKPTFPADLGKFVHCDTRGSATVLTSISAAVICGASSSES